MGQVGLTECISKLSVVGPVIPKRPRKLFISHLTYVGSAMLLDIGDRRRAGARHCDRGCSERGGSLGLGNGQPQHGNDAELGQGTGVSFASTTQGLTLQRGLIVIREAGSLELV